MSDIDLNTLAARKALAAKYAAKHGLDTALVCAVIEQESGWDTWAMRYEPAFYQRYIVPMGLEDLTAALARATSFGLMQLMGQTAIEFGFKGKFATSLCDPDTGVDFGCAKLRSCLDKHSGDETKALLSFNGGGDSHYPGQVQGRKAAYE